MGHMCPAWWRNPPNGTLGDTEDENLVEATVDEDDWPSLLEKRARPCHIVRTRAWLTSRRRDRARA